MPDDDETLQLCGDEDLELPPERRMRCFLPMGHPGPHRHEMIPIEAAEPCGAAMPGGVPCALKRGHAGPHNRRR